MALFRRNEKRSAAPIDLDVLIARLGQELTVWEDREVDRDLLRARVGDAWRTADLTPIPPDSFDGEIAPLVRDAARRFAVLVASFDLPDVTAALPAIVERDNPVSTLRRIAGIADQLTLLTLPLMRQSDIRLEEFARHFMSVLQLPVRGEEPDASTRRLHDINYARLMAEAEQARESAEERMEYLRKLQEEEERTRRPRRGKW